MKHSKLMISASLLAAVFASACSSSNSSSQSSEDKGYAFTGESVFTIDAYTTPDLSPLVQITNPDLQAVLLEYDPAKTNESQKAELQIVNQKDGKVVDSQEIDVIVQPTSAPKLEVISPTEPIHSTDLSMNDFVHAAVEQGEQTVPLDWVNFSDIVQGKPGYVLYDAETGEPFNPGTPWLTGEYQLYVVASDGMGLSTFGGPLSLTIDY